MAEERKRKRDAALDPAPAAVRVAISVAPSPPPPPPRRAAKPAAATQAAAVAPSAPPPPPPARGAARPKRSKPAKKKKTLSAKGRKAVVLNVMATVEAQKMAAGPPAAPAPPPPPPQAAPTPEDAAASVKRGKAWNKEDLATLTRLAEDPEFLRATIPDHPPGPELDWEAISRHFERFSKGGTAVRQQYYAVVRLMKQARREGRRGGNYVDMVRETLAGLPGRAGTVYEVQAALKKGPHAKCLDKYKEKGQVRWKKAVGECLREEGGLFENTGKNAAGKIIWTLKAQAG